MAHYSVVVAVEGGRLVARATRDFLHPVPAAALAVAAGDDVVWFCESGELRIQFDGSPFQTGIAKLVAACRTSTPSERIVAAPRGPREVFRYSLAVVAERGMHHGSAHLIVDEASVAAGDHEESKQTKRRSSVVLPAETISFSRDGESLVRARGEGPMALHALKVLKAAGAINYEYKKDTKAEDKSKAIPYLVVEPNDIFQIGSDDGALVIAFGKNGSPFTDKMATFFVAKGATETKTAVDDPEGTEGKLFKYTVVLLTALDKDIYIDDPHIIIDNT